MSRRTPFVLTAAVAAALCAIGSTTVVPASAAVAAPQVPVATPRAAAAPLPEDATTGRTAAGTPVDLSIALAPTDQRALQSLPTTTSGRTVADRARAIAGLAPGAARRGVVTRALAAAGFTVTATSSVTGGSASDANAPGAWQLDARGTAAQAEALFGVTLVGQGDGMHPTTEPVMPAAFAGAATSVVGLDTRPTQAHQAVPSGTYSPQDLASAYSASASSTAGAGATIATVQFSGWDRTDLATYAFATGRKLPAVDEVSVDGASVRTPDGHGGDTEVALDQEALLATAPAARQRIYVAPNTGLGTLDAYSQIAADVQSHGITAVSVSWGSCEADVSTQLRAVYDNVLARIVAAGATVFVATGDTGAQCPTYDAGGHAIARLSVSYPASSASVVAVGGTSLARSGSTWRETAWGNSSGAAGGGVSVAAKPSWQTGAGVTGTKRLVPDIAAVADPATGPGIFLGSTRGWVRGGGTSLASPVAAGQFAATLAARGCTVGIGDVHQALYANPRAFRDVTSGNNGFLGQRGYSATTGYDMVTGLGTPNWRALAAVLPTAAACATQSAARAVDGTVFTTGTWSAGASISSPNGQFWLELQADGNLVEWGNGRQLWSSNTGRYPGSTLQVRTNGDVVVVSSAGKSVWHTSTTQPGNRVVVTNGGDVQVLGGSTVRWHNGHPGADLLTPGGSLGPNQSLWDASGRHRLVMRDDGQLALYLNGVKKLAWSSGTAGATLRVQTDGNVVLYDVYGRAKWATSTSKYRGSGMRLQMQTGGNLVLSQGTAVRWQTRTKG